MLRVATIQQLLTIKLKYFLDVCRFEHRITNPIDWLMPVGLFIFSNILAFQFFSPLLMFLWLFLITITLSIVGLQALQTRKYNEKYVEYQKSSHSYQPKRFWEGGYMDLHADSTTSKNEEILASLKQNQYELKPASPETVAQRADQPISSRISRTKVEGRERDRETEKSPTLPAEKPYVPSRKTKYSEESPGLRKSQTSSRIKEERERADEAVGDKEHWDRFSDIKLQYIPKSKDKEEIKIVTLNQKVVPRQKILAEERRKAEIENQKRKQAEDEMRKKQAEEEERRRIQAEELRKRQEEEHLKKLREEEIVRKAREEARKKLEEEQKKKLDEEAKANPMQELSLSRGRAMGGDFEIEGGGQPQNVGGQSAGVQSAGVQSAGTQAVATGTTSGRPPVYNLKDEEYKKIMEERIKDLPKMDPFKLTTDQMEEAAKRVSGGFDIPNPSIELRGHLNRMTNDAHALKRFSSKILLLLKTYQSGSTEEAKKLYVSLIDQAVHRFMARSVEVIETRPKDIISRVVVSHVLEIEVPGFIDTLLYHITAKIKLLIPEVITRKPGMSDKDYYTALGYDYERDGTRESQDNYENRVKGFSILYFGLITHNIRDTFREEYDQQDDIIQGFQHMVFNGAKSYRWMFWKFAKMLLASPFQLMTPAVLTSLVRYCHFMLQKERQATTALLKLIKAKYFPKLKAFSDQVQTSTSYSPAEKLSCKNCTTELEGHLNEFDRTGDISNWFERE